MRIPVPGFRSGVRWKMVIASTIYAGVALVVLALIVAPDQPVNRKTPPENPVAAPATPAPSQSQSTDSAATPSNAAPAKAQQDGGLPKTEAEIQEYLRQNFSGTVWFGLIRDLKLSAQGYLTARTSIFPDAEGRTEAKRICGILLGNLRNNVSSKFRDNVKYVTVEAQNGAPIAQCST